MKQKRCTHKWSAVFYRATPHSHQAWVRCTRCDYEMPVAAPQPHNWNLLGRCKVCGVSRQAVGAKS